MYLPVWLTGSRAALGEKQASRPLVGTPQTFAQLTGRCLIKRWVSCCHLHCRFWGETWAPCSSPKALHQPRWVIKYLDSCGSEHGSLPSEVCGSRQKYPWNRTRSGSNQQPLCPSAVSHHLGTFPVFWKIWCLSSLLIFLLSSLHQSGEASFQTVTV